LETKILKGRTVSKHIKENLSDLVSSLKEEGVTPGLAAVLVGEDPASQVYVNSKSKVFNSNGCYSKTYRMPFDSTEEQILELINELNNSDKIHGILVQLPLPKHLDSKKILNKVDPQKDVDGFHPLNLGCLLEGAPNFIPCTPNGIIKILEYYNIETSGKHVVIIGRSNIVGKPMFALLAQKFKVGNSTVTMCHTGTKDISYFTKQADIIVAAVGVPEMLTGDMIKEGACLIDVGINRVEDKNLEKGYRLVGDIHSDSVIGKASSLTPVPGGVGPMTITMLLYNTVKSAQILK
jgi:methylenetetrahydrofolate dehydrogenase (NADP+)/methenyltetrahydrofolate cyclohydrolase